MPVPALPSVEQQARWTLAILRRAVPWNNGDVVLMRRYRIHYWNEVQNFGDRLSVPLFTHFTGITNVHWSEIVHSDAVITGSILHHIPPAWEGSIVGAGCLRVDLPVYCPSAKKLAIRGPLSAKVMAQRDFSMTSSDYALGDPGLLANELVNVPTRDYDLGVLPHWSDRELSHDPKWYDKKWSTLYIDPRLDPLCVIRNIGRCKKIVTSSLHGMIVADAFGIPRRFEPCKLTDTTDTLFKFNDYSRSINCPLIVGKTQEPMRGLVEARKHELYDAFRDLVSGHAK